MRVIAHRGASAYRPENTLEAFELAIQQGAHMVELDVRSSRDGEPVVVHDAVVRLPDATRRRVRLMSLAELRAALGEGPCPPLEAIALALRGRVALNVELKELGVARPAARLLRALDMEAEVLLSSFEPSALEAAGSELPRADRALLARRAHGPIEAQLTRLGARFFHVAHDAVDSRLVERLHRAHVQLQAYTVDEPQELERLAGLEIDGVFTNRPDLALELLARRA